MTDIKVGDEVIEETALDEQYKYVVTKIDGTRFEGLTKDGALFIDYPIHNVKKTGRHFPQIQQILDMLNSDVSNITELPKGCADCTAQCVREIVGYDYRPKNCPLDLTIVEESDETEREIDMYNVTDNAEFVLGQSYSSSDFCEFAKCPTCGKTVTGASIANPNYYEEKCPKCGQKLKWYR